MALYLHGVDAFVHALDEKLDLAGFVYQQLRTLPQLEVPWPPDLSLVAFRPRDGGDERADRRVRIKELIEIIRTDVGAG